jgi:GNAT superfamily N-acetyltransferase
MKPGASTHIILRPFRYSDQSFVYSTWIRGMYYGNSWAGSSKQSEGTFHRRYADVITAILSKPTTTIQVAALKDDDDVILGYAVTEPTILHWVYVKPTWRRFGIAKALIPANTEVITHQTHRGKSFAPKSWRYDPFMI